MTVTVDSRGLSTLAFRGETMGWSLLACDTRALILAMATLALANPAWAELPAATTSRTARDNAEKSIPWRDLSQSEQRTVRYITRNASIYRRLPTQVVDCDPELFNFLSQHPQVVTEIWKLMGVTALEVAVEGDGVYTARDAKGTQGKLEYLSEQYTDEARNTVLIYGEGSYSAKPLPRKVTAKCLMLLRSGSTVETNGRTYVTAVLDTWVLMDRAGADLVARTLQPVMATAADHNFAETMKFASTFSRTAEQNPSGMKRLGDKLTRVDLPTRQQMVEVCWQAHQRYAQLASERKISRVSRTTRSP